MKEVAEFNPSKNGLNKQGNMEVSFVPMADLQERQISFDVRINKK